MRRVSAAATAAFNYLSLFRPAGIRLDVFAQKIKVLSGYCHMTKDGKHQYSHFKRRNEDQNTDLCRFVISLISTAELRTSGSLS